MTFPPRAQTIIDQYRASTPANTDLTLRFGRCRVGVNASEPEIIDELADYFNAFLDETDGGPDIRISVHETAAPELALPFQIKPPDPGKTKIKEEWIDLPGGRAVRKRLTGMVFVFGGGEHLAAGPCRKNLNQVVNFINNRYIEWLLCHGYLLGHAAGVIMNGRGLGLAGFSGAGKSTLALHLMSAGPEAKFVSNDRLMVRREDHGVIMHGVAKLPRINPGTALNNPDLQCIVPPADRDRFSGLSREALWMVEHKYDAPIDQCFGPDRFVLDGPMDALVILSWTGDGGETSLRPVTIGERRDLLPAFMKSTGLFFLPDGDCAHPDPTPEAYIETLSACTVLEITGRIDFEAAVEALRAWTSGSPGR
jgi:HprK-related kinase B